MSSPADFHKLLCHKIEHAQSRIYLASLYVGPAVDPAVYRQEAQLLQALHKAAHHNPNVQVKLLLDKSRGLRPVPIKDSDKTITSAEACRQAIQTSGPTTPTGSSSHKGQANHNKHSVYLHSVLPTFLQRILPNPVDEVAGVFHIKVYIVDDELILSGANLSQEYFTDRHDRYLHIVRGGNGLVDWYAQLVQILCEHSEQYQGPNMALSPEKPRSALIPAVRRLAQPVASMEEETNAQAIFTDENCDYTKDSSIVAVACPTFQAPSHYGTDYRSDTDVLVDLLEQTPETIHSPIAVRLASAYLNPTVTLQKAWQSVDILHCLTAGYVSHGFRPKKKAGNKGRTWIPAIFDTLARTMATTMKDVHVWYYTRENWTYHAKGLWLSSLVSFKQSHEKAATDPRMSEDDEDLICVTHGSGNFGERSQFRDMESNLYLVLPLGSPLIRQHRNEWNAMCDYAVPAKETAPQELQWYMRLALPWIKRYF